MDFLLGFGIALALVYNLVNGANDAAATIGTVVATRATSPLRAVTVAAVFNFVGMFLLTSAVAETIATGIIAEESLTPLILLTALATAFVLLILATRLGLPVSSSHALIGGLIGAALAITGPSAILLPGPGEIIAVFLVLLVGTLIGVCTFAVIARLLDVRLAVPVMIGGAIGASLAVTTFLIAFPGEISGIFAVIVLLFVAPGLGIFAGAALDILISHLLRRTRQARQRRILRPLQVVSMAFQAVGHGSNDGQHAVGIIAGLLVATGATASFEVPFWILAISAGSLAIGTFLGGWRVIERVARGITKIRPYQGLAASVSTGSIVSVTALSGIPVSSTHVANGAIIDVGATRGIAEVNWKTVREIVLGWLITIPLSLGIAWLVATLINLLS